MTNMDETLMFVDWDDTLFPTTWLKMFTIDITNPSADMINMFESLDRLISEAIIKMRASGSIIIVSNGSNLWLQACLGVLPNFKEITETDVVSMVSARDLFSDQDNFPEDWKIIAFKILHDGRNSKKIISFGDSEKEHEAATKLKTENNLIGNVKFIRDPTLNQIVAQLELLTLLYLDFIEIDTDKIFDLQEYLEV
jgi:hypothetical protein